MKLKVYAIMISVNFDVCMYVCRVILGDVVMWIDEANHCGAAMIGIIKCFAHKFNLILFDKFL